MQDRSEGWPANAGALLMRWSPPPDSAGRLLPLARAFAARWPGAFQRIDCHAACDGSRLHLYFWSAGAVTQAMRSDALGMVRAHAGAEVVRLQPIEERPTASATLDAPFHYVVETDADAADADAVRDWYAQEHLAGLAAVQGAVRARRLANLDGGPTSFACYDLASLAVLESPGWLAVRATDWAGRVRPLFRNTRRTRFERAFTFQESP